MMPPHESRQFVFRLHPTARTLESQQTSYRKQCCLLQADTFVKATTALSFVSRLAFVEMWRARCRSRSRIIPHTAHGTHETVISRAAPENTPATGAAEPGGNRSRVASRGSADGRNILRERRRRQHQWLRPGKSRRRHRQPWMDVVGDANGDAANHRYDHASIVYHNSYAVEHCPR